MVEEFARKSAGVANHVLLKIIYPYVWKNINIIGIVLMQDGAV